MFKGNSRVLLMFLLLFLGVAAFLVVSLPYVSRLEGEVDSENDVATDLVTSLACYAALHGGRLPASEAAFRSSDVVIVSSEGVVCLRVPAVYTAQLGHFQNSIVKDLSEYHITWGANEARYGRTRCGCLWKRGAADCRDTASSPFRHTRRKQRVFVVLAGFLQRAHEGIEDILRSAITGNSQPCLLT